MSEPRKLSPWVWGGLGLVGVLVLFAVGLVMDRTEGPPPPVSLSPPEVAPGTAAGSARFTEISSSTPVVPSVGPVDEAPSGEFLKRREAYEAAPSVPDTRPRPPPLRKHDAGIAPKRLLRKVTGRSAGKGVADVLLVSTFQGKSVSAPVEIDGVWRGNTPLSVTVPAGNHVIRIDHSRTRVNEFLTDFAGGRSVRMEAELRPASESWGNKGIGKPHHH